MALSPWLASFVFAAVCWGCGGRSPFLPSTEATPDAGRDEDAGIEAGSDSSEPRDRLCTPGKVPPIDPVPHIDCIGRACGEACDPCTDPRTCVDATHHAFACNWARQCVEIETD